MAQPTKKLYSFLFLYFCTNNKCYNLLTRRLQGTFDHRLFRQSAENAPGRAGWWDKALLGDGQVRLSYVSLAIYSCNYTTNTYIIFKAEKSLNHEKVAFSSSMFFLILKDKKQRKDGEIRIRKLCRPRVGTEVIHWATADAEIIYYCLFN